MRDGRFAAARRLTNNVAHGPNLDALRQQLAAPDTVAAVVQLLQYAGAAHPLLAQSLLPGLPLAESTRVHAQRHCL